MRIVASAPGKLILAGEHSVVYSEPALATAIDLRTTVEIETDIKNDTEKNISVDLHTLNSLNIIIRYYGQKFHSELLSKSTGHSTQVQNSISAIVHCLNQVGIKQPLSMKISVTSSIPVGCGLGSSAAFSVSLAAAIIQLSGCYQKKLIDLANEIESIFHTNPSGIDTFVSQNGGLVEFQKMEKQFISKNIEIDEKVKGVLVQIVNSNVTRSTKSMVSKVRKNYEKNPRFIINCCKAITSLVEEIKTNLKSGEIEKIDSILENNHQMLNAIGVGHSSLDFAHDLARNKYNIVLKTTGAGGGGCMFSLKSLPKELIQELIENKFSAFRTSILATGLKVDVS